MWVRGLKLSLPNIDMCIIVSHPMWVRGLKRLTVCDISLIR